ncbi:hypothetical protein BKA93DRAFT_361295 [Sparassis latifolia]
MILSFSGPGVLADGVLDDDPISKTLAVSSPISSRVRSPREACLAITIEKLSVLTLRVLLIMFASYHISDLSSNCPWLYQHTTPRCFSQQHSYAPKVLVCHLRINSSFEDCLPIRVFTHPYTPGSTACLYPSPSSKNFRSPRWCGYPSHRATSPEGSYPTCTMMKYCHHGRSFKLKWRLLRS